MPQTIKNANVRSGSIGCLMKSILSALIIGCYILCCLLIRTRPWRYFQINARLFSRDKGIFSKLSIDKLIPAKWRLHQEPLKACYTSETFPVFVKPEWGQNAKGIQRADSPEELRRIEQEVLGGKKSYIVQAAATGAREFEIFTTFSDRNANRADIVTVTEAINASHKYPVNSINNPDTQYVDITNQFSEDDLTTLTGYKQEIGRFGQSRLSVRADNFEDLISGNFHVIELNLFTPMPINLMDEGYSWKQKLEFILKVGKSLARVTRSIDRNQKTFPVFTRMMLYGHERSSSPLGSVLRSFL